jgi:hypothetical protein
VREAVHFLKVLRWDKGEKLQHTSGVARSHVISCLSQLLWVEAPHWIPCMVLLLAECPGLIFAHCFIRSPARPML